MDDNEINQKVEERIQSSLIALRSEIVNLALAQDNKNKLSEYKIEELQSQILSLQMQGGIY